MATSGNVEVGSGYVSILPQLSKNFASQIDASFSKSGNSASNTFTKAFSNGVDKAAGLIQTVSRVGAGIATAGAVAVGNLAKQAVTAYGQYEQLVGGIETLFKESSNTVLGYADNAYMTAGLSANRYMETVTSFSATLLQGLGGDTEKAAEFANLAITDMADNVNKMGTDMQMVQNAYRGFAKQNFMMLDNLQLGYGGTREEMVRLINDSQILGKKIKNLDGVTFDQMISAIHKIQENLGITGTTALEAETTIEGSLNRMRGAWENLITGMSDDKQDFGLLLNNWVQSVEIAGRNIMPRIELALDNVAKLIDDLSPKVAERLPGLVQRILPSLINAVSQIVSSLIRNLPQLLSSIWDTLSQNTETGIGALGVLIALNMRRVITMVKGVFKGGQVFVSLAASLFSKLKEVIQKNIGSKMFDGFIKDTQTLRDASSNFNNAGQKLSEGGKKIKQTGTSISEAGETIKNSGSKISEGCQKMLGAAAVIASIGVAALGAGAGFYLMSMGAEKVANAGPLAAGALGIMGGTLLLFSAAILTLGKNLNMAQAPAILALGGALLLCGAGMMAVGVGAALVGSQGAAGIAALAIMSATMIVMVPLLALFGPLLDASSLGLISFGAAILLAGGGIALAAGGLALLVLSITQLCTQLPLVAEYGASAAVGFGALALGIGSVALASVGLTAALVTILVPLIGLIAPLGLVVAEFVLFDLACVTSFGSCALLAAGFLVAAGGAAALGSVISGIKSDCETAVNSMWELQGSVDVVGNAISGLKDFTWDAINGIIGIFSELASAGQVSFIELWNNVLSATNDGVNNVLLACSWLIDGIVGQFQNAYNAAFWCGNQIGQGVADGMIAKLWVVEEAANRIVSVAQKAVEAKAQIGSPSRLFRRIFYHIPEGAALGITDGENNVRNAVSELFKVNNTQPSQVYSTNTKQYAFADGNSSNSAGQVINIYFNNARLNDDEEMRETAMSLAKMVRRKERM